MRTACGMFLRSPASVNKAPSPGHCKRVACVAHDCMLWSWVGCFCKWVGNFWVGYSVCMLQTGVTVYAFPTSFYCESSPVLAKPLPASPSGLASSTDGARCPCASCLARCHTDSLQLLFYQCYFFASDEAISAARRHSLCACMPLQLRLLHVVLMPLSVWCEFMMHPEGGPSS